MPRPASGSADGFILRISRLSPLRPFLRRQGNGRAVVSESEVYRRRPLLWLLIKCDVSRSAATSPERGGGVLVGRAGQADRCRVGGGRRRVSGYSIGRAREAACRPKHGGRAGRREREATRWAASSDEY